MTRYIVRCRNGCAEVYDTVSCRIVYAYHIHFYDNACDDVRRLNGDAD